MAADRGAVVHAQQPGSVGGDRPLRLQSQSEDIVAVCLSEREFFVLRRSAGRRTAITPLPKKSFSPPTRCRCRSAMALLRGRGARIGEPCRGARSDLPAAIDQIMYRGYRHIASYIILMVGASYLRATDVPACPVIASLIRGGITSNARVL